MNPIAILTESIKDGFQRHTTKDLSAGDCFEIEGTIFTITNITRGEPELRDIIQVAVVDIDPANNHFHLPLDGVTFFYLATIIERAVFLDRE